MKNLENFGVQEMNAFEIENINGGTEYFDWVSFPPGSEGNAVVGIFVAAGNVVVGVANAGIAVANGVSALWSWATE
jgi:hypothetical protein